MRRCDTCGGTITHISSTTGKCEYCGKLFSIQDNQLSDANPEELYREASTLATQNNESSKSAAAKMFEALGNYKDSVARTYDCNNWVASSRAQEQDRLLEEQRQRELEKISRQQRETQKKLKRQLFLAAGACIAVVCILSITISTASNNRKRDLYSEAIALYEQQNYDDALEKFEKLKDYSDTADYIKTITNLIALREESYWLAVSYYDNGQYSNAIKELENCKNYLDSQEYTNNASEMLYVQAQDAFDGEDFHTAKNLLETIPKDAIQYNDAQVFLSNINEKIHEIETAQNYSQAIAYFESGEYESAQRLFIDLSSYEESNIYLNQIGEIIYGQAAALYSQQEYVLCGDQIALIDAENEWSGYSQALELKQRASDAYIEIIAAQAKDICRKDGESEMRTFLSGLGCSILSREDIDRLKFECKVDRMVLAEMRPLSGDSERFWKSGVGCEDNVGNSSYGYLTYCHGGGYTKELIYALDSKYTTLTCEIGLWQMYSTIGGVWFEFYGDGIKIGETKHFSDTTRPYTFELDITGVTDLTIVATSDEHYVSGDLLTNGFIVSN